MSKKTGIIFIPIGTDITNLNTMKNKHGGNRPNAGRKKDERYKLTITFRNGLKSTSKSFREFNGVIEYIKNLGI